jgi:hypothetical protein
LIVHRRKRIAKKSESRRRRSCWRRVPGSLATSRSSFRMTTGQDHDHCSCSILLLSFVPFSASFCSSCALFVSFSAHFSPIPCSLFYTPGLFSMRRYGICFFFYLLGLLLYSSSFFYLFFFSIFSFPCLISSSVLYVFNFFSTFLCSLGVSFSVILPCSLASFLLFSYCSLL